MPRVHLGSKKIKKKRNPMRRGKKEEVEEKQLDRTAKKGFKNTKPSAHGKKSIRGRRERSHYRS